MLSVSCCGEEIHVGLTNNHFGAMELVSAPRSDKGDTSGAEVRAKFARLDEVFLLRLCGIELECEEVSPKIIQRIAETRCAGCVYGEHIHAFGMAIWKCEGSSFESST